MESVIQHEKECFICKSQRDLHSHHIFYGTANRKKSEKYGMKVLLCGFHHNLSKEGVHFNHNMDMYLKEMAQAVFETKLGSREDFRRIFGKSYL